MDIQNQLSSLELSKQLEKLGVKQDSIFIWGIGGDKCEKEWTILFTDDDSWSAKEYYSAFTVAELIELIGDGLYIYMFGDACKLEIEHLKKFTIKRKPYYLPDVLANFLANLLENKLIKL